MTTHFNKNDIGLIPRVRWIGACGADDYGTYLTTNPAQVTCPQCLNWLHTQQPIGTPRMEEVVEKCYELKTLPLPIVHSDFWVGVGAVTPIKEGHGQKKTMFIVDEVEDIPTEFEKAFNEVVESLRAEGKFESISTHIGIPAVLFAGKEEKAAGYIPSTKEDVSEWGFLPMEPCRFCREQGCVYFNIDEGPEGKVGHQSQRCEKCKRTWIADSSSA